MGERDVLFGRKYSKIARWIRGGVEGFAGSAKLTRKRALLGPGSAVAAPHSWLCFYISSSAVFSTSPVSYIVIRRPHPWHGTGKD